jgi:hypothetical protein
LVTFRQPALVGFVNFILFAENRGAHQVVTDATGPLKKRLGNPWRTRLTTPAKGETMRPAISTGVDMGTVWLKIRDSANQQ